MFPSTGVKCEQLTQPASRGGQRTEDTQFTMMDYRTGLLLLTVCWAGQCSIRKEESMQNSDISPSTYVTAERRTEDRGHTV
ncbi:hypothetical protein F7725_003640 [Dissostichus mawsoni]|uniref:Uncharacterized protein n=1 Tax=Dissostichus mawsoni TaxID=36200 RepID=A0A7J5YAR9_DISMA|nr:hypothetical protein F7725_003640 [Dissostichus mawsoni]